MRKIPVGYITKAVHEVEEGDVIRFLGKVLDVFDGDEEEEYTDLSGEMFLSIPLIVVTPSVVPDTEQYHSFYFHDIVQVLQYSEVEPGNSPLEVTRSTLIFSGK